MVETVRITPDYRNLCKFQFVTGWTGGGAEMCAHLTVSEVIERLEENHGKGELVDDGTDLIWMQHESIGIPKLQAESLMSSSL